MSIDLEKATAQELRAFKSSIIGDEQATPEVVAQLDDLIITRSVEEGVSKAMASQKNETLTSSNDEAAAAAWPELNDEDSDFYKEVKAEMDRRGDGKTNPDALGDAAMKIGIGKGLTPVGFTPGSGATPMSAIAPGNGSGPEGAGKKGEFIKKTSKIAEAFGDLIDMKDEKVVARIEANAEGSE